MISLFVLAAEYWSV